MTNQQIKSSIFIATLRLGIKKKHVDSQLPITSTKGHSLHYINLLLVLCSQYYPTKHLLVPTVYVFCQSCSKNHMPSCVFFSFCNSICILIIVSYFPKLVIKLITWKILLIFLCNKICLKLEKNKGNYPVTVHMFLITITTSKLWMLLAVFMLQ